MTHKEELIEAVKIGYSWYRNFAGDEGVLIPQCGSVTDVVLCSVFFPFYNLSESALERILDNHLRISSVSCHKGLGKKGNGEMITCEWNVTNVTNVIAAETKPEDNTDIPSTFPNFLGMLEGKDGAKIRYNNYSTKSIREYLQRIHPDRFSKVTTVVSDLAQMIEESDYHNALYRISHIGNSICNIISDVKTDKAVYEKELEYVIGKDSEMGICVFREYVALRGAAIRFLGELYDLIGECEEPLRKRIKEGSTQESNSDCNTLPALTDEAKPKDNTGVLDPFFDLLEMWQTKNGYESFKECREYLCRICPDKTDFLVENIQRRQLKMVEADYDSVLKITLLIHSDIEELIDVVRLDQSDWKAELLNEPKSPNESWGLSMDIENSTERFRVFQQHIKLLDDTLRFLDAMSEKNVTCVDKLKKQTGAGEKNDA